MTTQLETIDNIIAKYHGSYGVNDIVECACGLVHKLGIKGAAELIKQFGETLKIVGSTVQTLSQMLEMIEKAQSLLNIDLSLPSLRALVLQQVSKVSPCPLFNDVMFNLLREYSFGGQLMINDWLNVRNTTLYGYMGKSKEVIVNAMAFINALMQLAVLMENCAPDSSAINDGGSSFDGLGKGKTKSTTGQKNRIIDALGGKMFVVQPDGSVILTDVQTQIGKPEIKPTFNSEYTNISFVDSLIHTYNSDGCETSSLHPNYLTLNFNISQTDSVPVCHTSTGLHITWSQNVIYNGHPNVAIFIAYIDNEGYQYVTNVDLEHYGYFGKYQKIYSDGKLHTNFKLLIASMGEITKINYTDDNDFGVLANFNISEDETVWDIDDCSSIAHGERYFWISQDGDGIFRLKTIDVENFGQETTIYEIGKGNVYGGISTFYGNGWHIFYSIDGYVYYLRLSEDLLEVVYYICIGKGMYPKVFLNANLETYLVCFNDKKQTMASSTTDLVHFGEPIKIEHISLLINEFMKVGTDTSLRDYIFAQIFAHKNSLGYLDGYLKA